MDVVFLTKEVPSLQAYEELRFALRSLEACYPHGDVWLVGGAPEWVQNVGRIRTVQAGVKWENTRLGLRTAVECDLISDPFILMNDDFFLLRPQKTLAMLHGGFYAGWLAAMRSRLGRSAYVRGGEETLRILKREGVKAPLCWSLHTPMRVDKTAARQALNLAGAFPRQIHMRTLIGNLSGLTGVQSRDVKLTGGVKLPEPGDLYLSTSDGSFEKGRIGRWIRAKFPEPSSFEQCSETRPE
jgi:hypothetical protein